MRGLANEGGPLVERATLDGALVRLENGKAETAEGFAEIGGEDFLRGLVQRTVHQVMEAEMTRFLGAQTD